MPFVTTVDETVVVVGNIRSEFENKFRSTTRVLFVCPFVRGCAIKSRTPWYWATGSATARRKSQIDHVIASAKLPLFEMRDDPLASGTDGNPNPNVVKLTWILLDFTVNHDESPNKQCS
jgi:hypothetical protein